MKRWVPFLAVFLLLAAGCKERPFGGQSKYKSLRSVLTNDIQELRERVAELEGDKEGKHRYITELGQLHYKLGKKYLESGNWDQAVESLEKSVSYGKDTPIVYYSLALAYGNRGRELKKSEDVRKAEHNYRRALELSRDFSDARYGLSILLFYEKDEKEEAVRMMEGLVSDNRSYFPAYFALARFHYEMEKPEKALSVYEDLYTQLQKKSDRSPEIKEYKRQCRENIQRLMQELSR